VLVTVKVQLAVLVAVFQHLVPFNGVALKPDVPNVYVPPGEAPDRETVVVDALDPSVNVVGVLVMTGVDGVVVMLPVSVPELTMLAAGHGIVDEVHANTVNAEGHKLVVPECLISR
jgi:hypothetical protein